MHSIYFIKDRKYICLALFSLFFFPLRGYHEMQRRAFYAPFVPKLDTPLQLSIIKIGIFKFVNQKSLKATFNTCITTKQYPFIILCLPTQIQMVIVSEKPDFYVGFKDFWCTNIIIINNHQICYEKDYKYVFNGKKFATHNTNF